MKNKPQVMEHHGQVRMLNWLYEDTAEDDFLMGKTPKDLSDIWEEEE